MRNNRLGCLTGTGIFSAVLTLFILVGVAFASGGQMFNAGDLNDQTGESFGGVNSHAQIEECKACHTAPWERETMADRCLDCHTNIAAQMMSIAELHGAIIQKDHDLACRDCHRDHRGKTASLTDLGNNVFPHEALGYSLEGHQFKVAREAFECVDCHGDDVTSFASDSCLTCHREMDVVFAQTHLLEFGAECLVCHDGIDTYGDDFDHNRFNFQLAGKHAGLACSQCHLNARSISDLQVTLQDCYSCHQQEDPHEFAYGVECQTCHSPEGWKPANFDHNLSAFRLEGRHAEAACEECHTNGLYNGTPTDCFSCHQRDDEHGGRFGTDCSICHVPSAWEDATFDHTPTLFPLTGAHVQVTCESCHKGGVYKNTPTSCVSCHAEPVAHFGQFGTDCAACHSTSAWLPAFYNGPHVFPMNHEGANNKCQTCHPDGLTTFTCYGCHEHNLTKIAQEHREEGISDFQNCVACHPTGREHEGGDDDD